MHFKIPPYVQVGRFVSPIDEPDSLSNIDFLKTLEPELSGWFDKGPANRLSEIFYYLYCLKTFTDWQGSIRPNDFGIKYFISTEVRSSKNIPLSSDMVLGEEYTEQKHITLLLKQDQNGQTYMVTSFLNMISGKRGLAIITEAPIISSNGALPTPNILQGNKHLREFESLYDTFQDVIHAIEMAPKHINTPVLKHLARLRLEHRKEFFYKVQQLPDSYDNVMAKLACMIYLVNTKDLVKNGFLYSTPEFYLKSITM